MRGNQTLHGVILVALGATSYGCLATFVKLAYRDTGVGGNPFSPAEIVTAQFALGIAAVSLIGFLQRRSRHYIAVATPRNIFHLLLAGTSTGLTSIFYYMAVKFIPVSIGIVLLMQTVWMGVLLEWLLEKRRPSARKLASVGVVLLGTGLATNLVENASAPDWRGLSLGLLAAASFTTTMFCANKIAVGVLPARRSLFMLLGGGIMVLFFALATQHQPFNYDIFYKWGILLALFGTVIPPILLNAGFPKTGIGLGSIVSSLELPVSVTMAFVLLGERVTAWQWLGVAMILAAIVLMNADLKKKTRL